MRRLLTCLLCLYVVLEFANPSVPGVVTFEGGAMETAQAERHRPIARPPDEPLLEMLAPQATLPGPVVRSTPGPMPKPRIIVALRYDQSVDPDSPAEDD